MEEKKKEFVFSYVSGFLLLAVVALLAGDYMFRHGGVEGLPQTESPLSISADVEISAESFVSIASNDGSAAALQSLILIVLALWLFRLIFVSLRKGLRRSQPKFFISRLLLFAGVALLLYGEFVSKGNPVLAVGPILPGSLLTRWLNLDLAIWFRRLLEPSIWLFCTLILGAAFNPISWSKIGVRYAIAAACFVGYLFAQVLWLFSFMRELGPIGLECGSYAIYLLGQVTLIILIDTIGREIRSVKGLEDFDKAARPSLFKAYVCAGAVACLLVVAGSISSLTQSRSSNLQIGAYYYSWFPQNWKSGYAWRVLKPAVLPQLGEYSSAETSIAEQHIAWARDAGISYFIFDWWPNRPEVRRNFFRMLSRKDLLSDFKFAMHYESLDIDDPQLPSSLPTTMVDQEGKNIIPITPRLVERLKKHWERIAKFYMKHPSYLRIDGKPVLFVYATRHLVGGLPFAVREARAHVKDKTGLDLFLVADEAFFNVMEYDREEGIRLRGENSPNWDRLLAFDAITSYNPYDSTRQAHAGETGTELYLQDVERTYRAYRRFAATAGIRFIPGIIPGYNDRGVRPKDDHYVIPRKVTIDTKEESLLVYSLKRIGFPFIDRELGMLTITSWNEWNEGTQIEPSVAGPCTTKDNSESQSAVTQGISHCGYGMGHLEELKAAIAEFKS